MNNLNHIAVIIDGNRRYAKSNNIATHKGHEKGAENVENFIEGCKELGIKEATIYCLSTENLKRDPIELKFLFAIFKKFFRRYQDNKEHNVKFIGDLSMVPGDIKELAEEIQEKTKNNSGLKINFCFAYGGRLELIKAFNKLKNKHEDITEEDITNNLWLSSSPELIIRTGNASRTSNFLPWQSVYSEWIFFEKMWPEFTKQDLISCIEDFNNRKRNFGK